MNNSMYITHSGVCAESLLGMKRRCRAIEVARPGVDRGHLSDGCQATSLLAEVEYAEPVGDEVQAPEAEGLGWLEDRWNPHPSGRECGEL